MKITLDQDTLNKAVVSHLRTAGVTADIRSVAFRYTRVPYTVFAEVDLADTPATAVKATSSPVVDREVIQAKPLVDPETLPPIEETVAEEPRPDAPSAPMFGS